MVATLAFSAATLRPVRRQASVHLSAYHGQCQAAATPSRASLVLAQLPQRRLAPRRSRGDSLVVYANWGAEVEFKPARVVERQPAAKQLHRVLVDLGQLAEGYTKPGQFVQVKVGDSKPGFFAIASPPDTNNAGVVELLIKEQEGPGAAALLCQASAGDEVLVSPVMGKGFPVDRTPPSSHPTLLLFATGSGISPVKALLESEALGAKDVRLFYGARNPDHMAYRERVPEWEAAGIKVKPVFSEEGQGYVQDALAKEDGIEDWSGVGAVLCGQKGMCEAVTEFLAGKGVAKEAILLNF